MKKLWEMLDKIAYISLILYMLDICILGTGQLVKEYFFSTRILFLMIAVFCSVPNILLNLKQYLKNKYCLLVVGFLCIILVNAIRGILNGNSMSILLSDVKGFLNFLILLPMISTLWNKERILCLIKIFIGALTAQAIVAMVLSFYLQFSKDIRDLVYAFFDGYGLFSLTILTKTATRVFGHTASRLFMVGFMCALGLIIVERKHTVLREIQMSLFMVGTFISYTRGIYLGIAVAFLFFAIIILVYYKEMVGQVVRSIVRMFIITISIVLVLGVFQRGNLFIVAIDRCLISGVFQIDSFGGEGETPDVDLVNSEDEVESLSLRQVRMKAALRNIGNNPLLGNGLGVVNDPDGQTIEYFYLDLTSKIGILGLIVFIVPMLFAIRDIIISKKQQSRSWSVFVMMAWISCLYMMTISYFNPCMNTSIGLFVYSLLIVLVNVRRINKSNDKEMIANG